MAIITLYRATDGYRESKQFQTLAAARRYFLRRMGTDAEVYQDSLYAVTSDGVGTLWVDGDASVADLMPHRESDALRPWGIPSGMYWDSEARRLEYSPNESGYLAMQGDHAESGMEWITESEHARRMAESCPDCHSWPKGTHHSWCRTYDAGHQAAQRGDLDIDTCPF